MTIRYAYLRVSAQDAHRVLTRLLPWRRIATDFGVHPMTLHKWMRQADIDEGAKPGKSTGESAELRDARRRIKLLEQENEVLRRATAYLSQANLPGKGSTRS